MNSKKAPVSPALPAELDLTPFFGGRIAYKTPAKTPVSPAETPADVPLK